MKGSQGRETRGGGLTREEDISGALPAIVNGRPAPERLFFGAFEWRCGP